MSIPDTMVGRLIGKYRLTSFIGEGGTGEVYEAEHEVIGRKAAVKFLRDEFSQDKSIISRFISEARAVNGIRHPNIVDITDFGEIEGRHFLIMELLDGETLAERLTSEGRIKELTAADLAHQVASALAAAHESGFIHRDIKPENLFLSEHPDRPQFVKVLDFGIAKLMGETGQIVRQTATGSFVGTPTYMSPEQCLGHENIDGRSDIYSLGIVLYEMVVGHPPFEEETLGKLIMSHCKTPPVPPAELNPELSNLMNRTILQALEKNPRDRFMNIEEFRKRLRALALRPGMSRLPYEDEEPGEMIGGSPEPEEERSGELPTLEAELPKFKQSIPAKVSYTITGQSQLSSSFTQARAKSFVTQPKKPERTEEETIEIKSERVTGKLNSIVKERISTGRFALPAMPQVVVKSLKKLEDPNFNFTSLASIINQDPLIVAQVLKVANSVAFAAAKKAVSLEAAISRIGGRYLRAVLLELSARRIFESRNPRIRDALDGIWKHSRATSLIASEIAIALEVEKVDPEIVALAGLLHDAGKPMTAGLLLEAERQITSQDREFMNHEIWLKVVNQAHRDVGLAVAKAWKLPKEISMVISKCGNYNEEDRHSMVNYITLANAVAKQEAPYPEKVPIEDIVFVIRTGCEILELEEETLDQIVTDLKEQLEEEG